MTGDKNCCCRIFLDKIVYLIEDPVPYTQVGIVKSTMYFGIDPVGIIYPEKIEICPPISALICSTKGYSYLV